MSLNGALFSGVSGLNAQSQSLGIISDNISNANTVGYKSSRARFATLVTEQVAGAYSPGGVRAKAFSEISKQGLLQASDTGTHIALNGEGFLTVNSQSTSGATAEFLYTRAGAFQTDPDGNLVNSAGYFLYGWSTDNTGVPITTNTSTLTALEAVNIRGLSGNAKATTNVSLDANLPSTATAGDSHSVTTQIVDALGTTHNISFDFAKTATANQWTLTVGNPTLANDDTVTTGATAFGPATVVFNGDGSLASISTTAVAISGWTTGALNSAISIDVGTAGATDGVTQFSDKFLVKTTDQDGVPFGFFTGVSFDEDGVVSARFDNGETQKIFRVPVVTFPSAEGLEARNGNAYAESRASGAHIIQFANNGGAGKIAPASLEASTVELADEFANMITTQRFYAANARLITTADNMLEELMALAR